MAYRNSLLVFVLCALLLSGCGGGIEDKEGKAVKVGETYLMTKKGLEHVPPFRDKAGSPLEVGKQYVMTAAGPELVPYLKDKNGRKVEIGSEYMATEEGLRLVQARSIRGTVQDASGKPIQGVAVQIAGSEHKGITAANGSFSLPFVEGYVNIAVEVPNLPQWCKMEKGAVGVLSREAQPQGWDAGVIKLPCQLQGITGGKSAWASADGALIDNGDGTVSDTRNALMWEAEIKEHGVSWFKAVDACKKLNLGGHSDWRVPTLAELATLTQAGSACGWHGSPVIRGALSVWASDQPDPTTAMTVNLCAGTSRRAPVGEEGPGVSPSVLAVRSLKK